MILALPCQKKRKKNEIVKKKRERKPKKWRETKMI
jgi:hypothetical protein